MTRPRPRRRPALPPDVAVARVVFGVVACLVGFGLGTPGPGRAEEAPTESVADRHVADRHVAEYVERYLDLYPTRATAAGDARHDRRLENLTDVRLADWLEFNERTVAALEAGLGDDPSRDLDARAVLRQARRELFRHRTLRVSRTDPLFWTGIVGGMSSHLLVRDDRPLVERLRALAVRVGEVPRLAAQARAALGETPPESFSELHVAAAARQAAAAATFFDAGLAAAASGLDASVPPAEREALRVRLDAVGRAAAASLHELAAFLEERRPRARGSARLGELYAESFRLGTGVDTPLADVLADAERRLVEERGRTAAFCRSIWTSPIWTGPIWKSQGLDVSSGRATHPAADSGDRQEADRLEADREMVRACFDRIARDHAADLDEFVADYRRLAAQAENFAVARGLVDLPEGFRLVVDTSPSYFVGQAVGGVYPPGPFAPDGAVLLFVPSYPEGTPDDAVAAFHRDFNDHFNTMITPHETVPGHGSQIALAAHRAARTGEVARELFADGVYVEGWGTFSELLMLDAGWGGPLDRVAHLEKRLENLARLIVDIRVHTTDVTEEEILRFVRDEALQDEQFAANMWRRALLSSPQLTTYDLGSRRIYDLYRTERERLGDSFDAGAFVRSLTRLGSVSLDAYESARLLNSATAPNEVSAGALRVAPRPGTSHGL